MLPSQCKSDTHSAVAKAARGSPGTGTAIQPRLSELGFFPAEKLDWFISLASLSVDRP
jgi:hypothetical protein